eukprot:5912797-Pyramimonas_sp.AAC.1
MEMARRAVGLQGLLREVLGVAAVGRASMLGDAPLRPQERAFPLQRERVQGLLAELQDTRAVVRQMSLHMGVIAQRSQRSGIPQARLVNQRLHGK